MHNTKTERPDQYNRLFRSFYVFSFSLIFFALVIHFPGNIITGAPVVVFQAPLNVMVGKYTEKFMSVDRRIIGCPPIPSCRSVQFCFLFIYIISNTLFNLYILNSVAEDDVYQFISGVIAFSCNSIQFGKDVLLDANGDNSAPIFPTLLDDKCIILHSKTTFQSVFEYRLTGDWNINYNIKCLAYLLAL